MLDANNLSNLINSLKDDSNLQNIFTQNPISIIEKFLGKDLPDEQVSSIINQLSGNLDGLNSSNLVQNILGGNLDSFDVDSDGKFGMSDIIGIADKFFKK